MYARHPVPAALQLLAEQQHGVLTSDQLTSVPRAALRRVSDDWTRLGRGVYCVTTPTWLSAAFAGILRGGSASALGSLAAAHLLGLHDDEPDDICVWVPETISKPVMTVDQWRIRFRRGLRAGVGFPPRTRTEETLLDCAKELGEDDTVAMITRALTQRATTASRILAASEERIRIRHRTTIRALCDATADGVESVLEWRYLERVERQHGLPPMHRQVQVGRHRLDGLYPDFGVVLELDGRAFHDTARDMHRDNVNAVEHGLTTLRYGWHAVTSTPCEVAQQVAATLRQRGWSGSLRRCDQCPSLGGKP